MPIEVAKSTDVAIDRKPFALALEAQRAALIACHQGRRLATGIADAPSMSWWVARVSPEGRAEEVAMAETNAPAPSTACVQRVIEGIDFGKRAQPVALSVWLTVAEDPARAAPAPASSVADVAPPPVPRSDCASDNVEAYLPACAHPMRSAGSLWGDPMGEWPGHGAPPPPSVSAGTPTVGPGLGDGGHAGSGKPPQVRMGGTSVTGKLPAEVIQRIVRQNFAKFRRCYEIGLRSSPSLAGSVTTGFVIGRDGLVANASNAGSSMPDLDVVSCVVRAFATLKFPQPEDGVVRVTFPIAFSPGDGADGMREASSIRGIGIDKLTGPELATALTRDGARAASVAGDPTGNVPFVVFVDVVFSASRAGRYVVLRLPKAAPFAKGLGYTDGTYVVDVVPIGDAPLTTSFVD